MFQNYMYMYVNFPLILSLKLKDPQTILTNYLEKLHMYRVNTWNIKQLTR